MLSPVFLTNFSLDSGFRETYAFSKEWWKRIPVWNYYLGRSRSCPLTWDVIYIFPESTIASFSPLNWDQVLGTIYHFSFIYMIYLAPEKYFSPASKFRDMEATGIWRDSGKRNSCFESSESSSWRNVAEISDTKLFVLPNGKPLEVLKKHSTTKTMLLEDYSGDST